jgi:hypothetical protein
MKINTADTKVDIQLAEIWESVMISKLFCDYSQFRTVLNEKLHSAHTVMSFD